jgi:hypothetical protein
MKLKKGRYYMLPDEDTGDKVKVLITEIDFETKQIKYETPDGMTKAISIAKFLVIVIPYMESIIDFLVKLYRKYFKLKSRNN